MKSLKIKSSLH